MKLNAKWIVRHLIVGVVAVMFAVPAHAAFPGKNGRIAFVQGPDVYTMNSDGSDVKQLTALTDDNSAFWENWSADGKQLVFSEFPALDFFGQLWVMSADGSNQHLLLNDPGFDDEGPSFSPDGSQVVFFRCQPFHNEFPCAIYVVRVDGTGLQAITPFRIELGDLWPEYSPDGGTISFTSFGRDGILGGIYLMNSDGTHIHRLTPAATGGFLADWSPDGNSLAFGNHCCNPPLVSVLTIRKNGKNLRHVTHSKNKFNDSSPAWSPEGDASVFRRFNIDDNSGGIWIISADGTREKLIRALPAGSNPKHTSRFLHRPARPQRRGMPTELEDGGNFPRWGVAP